MKRKFIIGALLVVALIGGISYGYATYSNKKNLNSNEKIYSELENKIAENNDLKNNDSKKENEKDEKDEKDEKKAVSPNISDESKKDSKEIKNTNDVKQYTEKDKNNNLTIEDKEIIKIAEKYEGINNNKDIVTCLGDKKLIDGETYYHVHMVSKKLINQGGSGTVDDFYINKNGKVLKNTMIEKNVNDNNIKSNIINLAEKHEGVINNKDIVTVICGRQSVNGQTYYHIHMTSKKLINQGGSGTVDDFYINENGNVLKNINN